jgi:hypothetical protein
MNKWEYRQLRQTGAQHSPQNEFDYADDQRPQPYKGTVTKLNELGQQGWELIAVSPLYREGSMAIPYHTIGTVYHLRREVTGR